MLKTLRDDARQNLQNPIALRPRSLTASRKAAAAKLAKLAETQINSLAMKVRFEISVIGSEQETSLDLARLGRSRISYRHQPRRAAQATARNRIRRRNVRVMLALKVSVEEGSIRPRTKLPRRVRLVFDEIDIGIGGRAADAVGQKLKALGRGQQVLCVTHLPQIAAFADQHFVVEKREDHGRTKMHVRLLDDRARTHEVARMLSGAKVTETSLQHAAQMIATSR